MIFLSRDEVMSLFNDFDIVFFNEAENDALTGLGKLKHWHLFNIIAKKK